MHQAGVRTRRLVSAGVVEQEPFEYRSGDGAEQAVGQSAQGEAQRACVRGSGALHEDLHDRRRVEENQKYCHEQQRQESIECRARARTLPWHDGIAAVRRGACAVAVSSRHPLVICCGVLAAGNAAVQVRRAVCGRAHRLIFDLTIAASVARVLETLVTRLRPIAKERAKVGEVRPQAHVRPVCGVRCGGGVDASEVELVACYHRKGRCREDARSQEDRDCAQHYLRSDTHFGLHD
mmetsp:Transcript_11720/g.49348  ORF Transcript_11720/g.49348 Transcript_11720/m.49348 type:complete len:236 (+) Transcript_11720:405-1112(+)